MKQRESDAKHTILAKFKGDFVKKLGVQMVEKIAKTLDVNIEELIK